MPYRRRKPRRKTGTSTRTRRATRRKTGPRTSRAILRVPNYMQSLSTQRGKFIRLRYVEAATVNPGTSGALGVYTWRANGIYDPNVTGTGGQPSGHDQLALMYNKYCVVSSRFNVTLNTQTYSATDAMAQCGVILTNTQTLPYTGVSTLLEQQRTRWACIPPDRSVVRKLTSTFSAKSFFNITDIKDNMDNLGSTFGADPAEQAYFVLWAGNESGSDSGVIDALVVIDYVIYVSEATYVVPS